MFSDYPILTISIIYDTNLYANTISKICIGMYMAYTLIRYMKHNVHKYIWISIK